MNPWAGLQSESRRDDAVNQQDTSVPASTSVSVENGEGGIAQAQPTAEASTPKPNTPAQDQPKGSVNNTIVSVT